MLKFQRDSLTVHAPVGFTPKDVASIGMNITKGGEVELRVNQKVVGRLPIRVQLESKPEAKPMNLQAKQRDVSN